jgi:hypothetical protein
VTRRGGEGERKFRMKRLRDLGTKRRLFKGEVMIMNNLEIEIRMVKVIRIVLSILLIINGLTWLISHYGRFNAFDLSYSVLILTAGIVFLYVKTGTEKILIRTDDTSIFIKWVGLIREKQLLFTDIDRISLKKSGVEIERLGEKRMKYNLDNLEVWQKREVYDYFIRFSKEKDIIIERHFETN